MKEGIWESIMTTIDLVRVNGNFQLNFMLCACKFFCGASILRKSRLRAMYLAEVAAISKDLKLKGRFCCPAKIDFKTCHRHQAGTSGYALGTRYVHVAEHKMRERQVTARSWRPRRAH